MNVKNARQSHAGAASRRLNPWLDWRPIIWAFLALLPVALLGLVSYRSSARQLMDLLEANIRLIAQQSAVALKEKTHRLTDLAQSLASLPGLSDRLRDADGGASYDQLLGVREAGFEWVRIRVADSEGNVLGRDRDAQAATEPKIDLRTAARLTWLMGPDGAYALRTRSPVRDGVAISGWVICEVPVGTVLSQIQQRQESKAYPSRLVLLDVEKGRVIAIGSEDLKHEPVQGGLAGMVGPGQREEIKRYSNPTTREEWIAAVNPVALGEARCLLVVEAKLADFLAPVRQLRWCIVISTLVVAVLLVIIIVRLALLNNRLRRAESAWKSEHEQLRTLIDNLPDYIFIKDTDGRLILNNRAHALALGAASTVATDCKPASDLSARDVALNPGVDESAVLREGRTIVNQEEPYVDGNGHRRWLSSTKVPLRNAEGKIVGLVGISRDVTESKMAKEDLAHKTVELARSNSELEAFAYIASHDLQEPLRMVTGYMRLLEQKEAAKLDEQSQDYVRHAVEGAARMREMIQSILDYSRLDRRGAALVPVDLGQVIKVVLANLGPTIQETKATVTYDPMPVVDADSGQVARLFQNLLGNALKFRRTDVPVKVHIKVTALGTRYQFEVTDNGIGIAPEHRDRIFQLFQRLHTRDEYPGAGIGLAICKRIVERHGGEITVESVPGQGATFRFTLPAATGELWADVGNDNRVCWRQMNT